MKRIRTYGNYICGLLALIVLNVSIDIPDELLYQANRHHANEINEMESVAEFVVEACLNAEDAFPETEGDDEGGDNYVKKGTNWKPAPHSGHSCFISSLLFTTYNYVYIQSYVSIKYRQVPYAPPCSA